MSAPDEEETDELLNAYRHASDADAGRPSAKTRAAILAEARAAAARRAPAANESRFAWRVVASLAVVGVALVIWRQLPRDATAPLQAPQAPVIATEPAPQTQARKADANDVVPAVPDKPAVTRNQSAAPAPGLDLPRPRAQERASAVVAPAPPPVIVDLDVRQPVPESTIEIPRPSSQAFGAARARSSDTQQARAANELREAVIVSPAQSAVGIDALVRREFPTLLGDATPPAGVWIVQDAGGRTLRTGTLAPGESLGTVMGRLQRELPDRRLRPFEIANLRTTQGTVVLVGVARAQ